MPALVPSDSHSSRPASTAELVEMGYQHRNSILPLYMVTGSGIALFTPGTTSLTNVVLSVCRRAGRGERGQGDTPTALAVAIAQVAVRCGSSKPLLCGTRRSVPADKWGKVREPGWEGGGRRGRGIDGPAVTHVFHSSYPVADVPAVKYMTGGLFVSSAAM